MRAGWLVQGLGIVLGATIALTAMQGSAVAARHKSSAYSARYSAGHGGFSRVVSHRYARSWHPSWQRSALQCVPFARENSGIELSGNAGTWWNNATGLYERGARPEVGSILNFRATGRMRMGHVAVVTNVISPRHIEIDHANWGAPGRISRNIDVVDVSPSNDWTDVRVALSQSDEYGSVYPTYGFIYDRPDHGTMVANNAPMPAPTLRSAPTNSLDLDADVSAPEEVAEAASDDDGSPAPRYSSRHHFGRDHSIRDRFVRGGRMTMHASAAAHSRHNSAYPAVATYRVSAHGSAMSSTMGRSLTHHSSHRRL